MLKFKKSIFVIAVALVLIGCGGGGGGSSSSGSGSSTYVPSDKSYLKVINSSQSDSDICAIYSNTSDANNWGPDRLGSTTLPPGYAKLYQSSNCNRYYDLKVVFCDNYVDKVLNYYRECGKLHEFVFRNY